MRNAIAILLILLPVALPAASLATGCPQQACCPLMAAQMNPLHCDSSSFAAAMDCCSIEPQPVASDGSPVKVFQPGQTGLPPGGCETTAPRPRPAAVDAPGSTTGLSTPLFTLHSSLLI